MVCTTSAQVRLAKLDRQIAELQAERTKLVGNTKTGPAEELAEVTANDPINRIVFALQLAGDPLSCEQLQTLAMLPKATVVRTLKLLLGTGTVVKTGKERGTRYTLARQQAAAVFGEQWHPDSKDASTATEPEQPKQKRTRINPDVIVAIVTKCLGEGPKTMKDLIATTALDKGRLRRALVALEIGGQIKKIGMTQAMKYSLKVAQ
jgi:hypothetical protein